MAVFLTMILALLSAGANAGEVKPEEIVAHFGDTPIYAEELAFHLRDEVALVAVYFKTTHGVDLAGKAWRGRFGGHVPLERLRERALESCRTAKAVQCLAVERGLSEPLSFPGFAASCADLNRFRAEAKTEGRTLYGPLAYDPPQLYKYLMGNMCNRLRDTPGEVDYDRREAMLRSSIDQRRDQMSVRVDPARLDTLAAAQVGADEGLSALGTLPGRRIILTRTPRSNHGAPTSPPGRNSKPVHHAIREAPGP